MPYPAKLSADAIIAAAIAQLDGSDGDELSLRGVAQTLGITPHALYRYFADRAALEAAVAAQSFADLLAAMEHAARDRPPLAAVEAAARAYVAFAAAHPARYRLLLAAPHDPAAKSAVQHAVWDFVIAALTRLTGHTDNDDAALALWALLHGYVTLLAADIAGGEAQVAHGLAIFLRGLSMAEA